MLDFGQNLVGRVRIRVEGAAGRTVTMRTAEVMQEGEVYTRPLRDARSTDTTCSPAGGGEEWEPRFTFHGFRYVEIAGWPGDIEPPRPRATSSPGSTTPTWSGPAGSNAPIRS